MGLAAPDAIGLLAGGIADGGTNACGLRGKVDHQNQSKAFAEKVRSIAKYGDSFMNYKNEFTAYQRKFFKSKMIWFFEMPFIPKWLRPNLETES